MKFNEELLHRAVWGEGKFSCLEGEIEGSINVPLYLLDRGTIDSPDNYVGLFRFFGFTDLSVLPAERQLAIPENPTPESAFIVAGLGILALKKSVWFNNEPQDVDYSLGRDTNQHLQAKLGLFLAREAITCWGQQNYMTHFNTEPMPVTQAAVDAGVEAVAYQLIFGKKILKEQFLSLLNHKVAEAEALNQILAAMKEEQETVTRQPGIRVSASNSLH